MLSFNSIFANCEFLFRNFQTQVVKMSKASCKILTYDPLIIELYQLKKAARTLKLTIPDPII